MELIKLKNSSAKETLAKRMLSSYSAFSKISVLEGLIKASEASLEVLYNELRKAKCDPPPNDLKDSVYKHTVLNTPIVLITSETCFKFTLIRNNTEVVHSFTKSIFCIQRDDIDYPVYGPPDDDGYVYYIKVTTLDKAPGKDTTCTYIYVSPDEAESIIQLTYKALGRSVQDYEYIPKLRMHY